MAYTYETHLSSPNFTKTKRVPKGITIHHWGLDGQSHNGVARFLCTPKEKRNPPTETSAHYVVSENRVTCIVDPDFIAWHGGDSQTNRDNIGIECRPEMWAKDLETVAELIADLRDAYGNLPLNQHKDFKNTACPGRWSAKLGWLDTRANEIRSTRKAVTVTDKATPDVLAGISTDDIWNRTDDYAVEADNRLVLISNRLTDTNNRLVRIEKMLTEALGK